MPTYREDLHLGHKPTLVETDDLMDKGITTDKLDDAAVTTPKIDDKAITTPKLDDKSVTTPKLDDAAVTTPKIADDSVTTPKLGDASVTTPKIADKNVTWDKLDDDLQNVIASRKEGGVALSNKLGNSELLGITQKKLTEEITDIKGQVGSIADEEDLTVVKKAGLTKQVELKLKDKAYDPDVHSGMGRKYLRKNNVVVGGIPFMGIVENVNAAEGDEEEIIDEVFFDRVRERFVGAIVSLDPTTQAKSYSFLMQWEDYGTMAYSLYVPISISRMYDLNGVPYKWSGSDLVVYDGADRGEKVKNVLTQAMLQDADGHNLENTIFHIQYDYTLDGESIEVPTGSILLFEGGSISNGTLTGDFTVVKAIGTEVFNNVTLPGNVESIDKEVADLKAMDNDLSGRIAEEANRAMSSETNLQQGIGSLDSRLQQVEGLAELSVEGGQIGIASATDFTNRTAEGDLKIPTVGAILNGADEEPTAGSENLVKSGGVQNELALGAVYDVSAKNPTAGPNSDGKFESLSALLSDANINTLIPTSVRKGGMSVKFVQSSDNKYVQFRYMLPYGGNTTAENNKFVTPTNWQGVDDVPTAGSDNLVKSGGVFNFTGGTTEKIFDSGIAEHSSNNDRITANIPSGEKFTLKLEPLDSTVISAGYVYVKYVGESSAVNIGSISVNTAKEFTAANDIESIGVYFVVTTRGNVRFTLHKKTIDEKINESSTFASEEKVKEVSIENDSISPSSPKLAKSSQVANAIMTYANVNVLQGTASNAKSYVNFDTVNKTVTFPDGCQLSIGNKNYSVGNLSASYAGFTTTSALKLVYNISSGEFRFLMYTAAISSINDIIVAIVRKSGSNTFGINMVNAIFDYSVDGVPAVPEIADTTKPDSKELVNSKGIFQLVGGNKTIKNYYNVSIAHTAAGSHSYLDDVIPVFISKGEYFGIWPVSSAISNREVFVKYRGESEFTSLGTVAAAYSARSAIKDIEALGLSYDISGQTTVNIRIYTFNLADKLTKLYDNAIRKLHAIVNGHGSTVVYLASLEPGDYVLSISSDTGITTYTGTEAQTSWIEIACGSIIYTLSKTQTFAPKTVNFSIEQGRNVQVSVSRFPDTESINVEVYKRADYDAFVATKTQSLTEEQKTIARNNLNVPKNKETIAEYNAEAIDRINAAKTKLGSYGSVGNNSYLSTLILTDSHSDWTRINRGFEFGDTDNADIILHLGDITERSSNISGYNWKSKTLALQTPVLAIVGNHDVAYVNSSDPGLTDAQVQSILYDADEVAHNGEIHPTISNVVKPYFYKDITKNGFTTRFIGLYQFEWDVPTTGGVPDYKDGHGKDVPLYSQEQIDWLVETLQNTPSNYGVIILSHFILGKAKYEDCTFNEPSLRGTDISDAVIGGWASNKHFFYAIINAFVNGGSLSVTTDQITEDGVNHPLTVETTFTGGGKFIANLCGHKHSGGLLKFVDSTDNLSSYRIVMGACTSSADVQNTGWYGRKTSGKTQDCLNVVIYDNNRDKVKVVRLGSDINNNLEDCKCYIF